MMKHLVIVIVLLSLTIACKTSKKQTMISGEKAIALAKEFVKKQGYTSVSVNHKKNPIVFEKGEFASDTLQILKYRYNTLNPTPIGAKQHAGSWTVAFEYTNYENNIGRAVTMDTLGKKIIMQPKELRLDWMYEAE